MCFLYFKCRKEFERSLKGKNLSNYQISRGIEDIQKKKKSRKKGEDW